ncbi:MAG: hypothetical protein Q9160_009004 [Pyrenula sp. 1 TL-2023]
MTTPSSLLNEYLIIIPDVPHTIQKRLKVRPQHFVELKPDIASQKVTFGGAMLEEHLKPGDDGPQKMCGSAMLIRAASQEEALERVRKDVYTKEGVWDMDKVQVWPVCKPISPCSRRLFLGPDTLDKLYAIQSPTSQQN